MESAKLIAGLARIVRDVGLAEDLAQDALLAALERWPQTGVPDNPGAWLMATAKHRSIDHVRRRAMLERKHEQLGHELEAQQEAAVPDLDAAIDDHVGDDLLRLMFTACHPVLSTDAREAGDQLRRLHPPDCLDDPIRFRGRHARESVETRLLGQDDRSCKHVERAGRESTPLARRALLLSRRAAPSSARAAGLLPRGARGSAHRRNRPPRTPAAPRCSCRRRSGGSARGGPTRLPPRATSPG